MHINNPSKRITICNRPESSSSYVSLVVTAYQEKLAGHAFVSINIPRQSPWTRKKPLKTSIRIAGSPTVIRTVYLQNTSPQHYRFVGQADVSRGFNTHRYAKNRTCHQKQTRNSLRLLSTVKKLEGDLCYQTPVNHYIYSSQYTLLLKENNTSTLP